MVISIDNEIKTPTWKSMLGHQDVCHRIFELITEEKLPPVLLLEGRPGIGKSMLAAAILARHFCEDGDACGVCAGCRLVASGTHPETLWIDSGGASLKVAETEAILEHLSLSASMGNAQGLARPARIVVVIDIDLMNEAGINKLLKILEEPPNNSRVILTTSRGGSLLPTLLSRVNKWKIRPPTLDECVTIVQKVLGRAGNGLDIESLELSIRRHGFSPGRTLQGAMFGNSQEFRELCRDVVDPSRVLNILESSGGLGKMKKSAGEVVNECEIALNSQYRSYFENNGRTKLPESLEGISQRREVLRRIRYFGGRRKIALNTVLSAEGIGLSKFRLG